MFLILSAIVIIILYYYSTRNFNYFAKRKIKCEPPIPIFGNHSQVVFARLTEIERISAIYNKYQNEKVVGYFRGTTPDLIVRDPELLKHIFNLDFLQFHQRGLGRDPKYEPVMLNLFSADGDRWKLVRHGLSPAFTSSKLKSMFPIIVDCAEKLEQVAMKLALQKEDFDFVDLSSRFTIEIIGSCGFGIEMDTMNNEHCLFLQLRDMIFIKSIWQIVLFGIRDLFPNSIIKRIPISRPDIMRIINEIVNGIRRQRLENNITRNDFMNLLLEIQKNGKITGESLEETDENGKPKQVEIEFDDAYVSAQLFIFFAAGFETASTAMSFTMHQLAYHPEIQRKIQEEIDTVLSKYDNKLCFEAVNEMTLLECAFKEAMRLFPPGGLTTRFCAKEFKVPNSNITIEAGTRLIIPIQAIHMDPKYFDNPTEFRPDRFTPDATKSRHKYVYLPFGEGPRKCIGARLGIVETMAGLAAILRKFTVEPSPLSTRDIVRRKTSYLVQAVEGGLPCRLTLREQYQEKKCENGNA
ncbi:cytochrome P450 6B5-like [Leptidea sinapis]|uniref:cytochrome P450 6B5-like n=1 Tax=Leptidea sinapis TaxID=189913 RepID=UPI0021383057|nr:cytochrome P450 6B5-like [Leptidea sinapis]